MAMIPILIIPSKKTSSNYERIEMNILNTRESDDEKSTNNGKNIIPNPNLTTSSWTKLRDPRIVRVSRAFGGKDRHSKVCTVRGLRDRRVRLSVQTAIQLYDLQDRLGLNQPSKVVDWLLDVAKHEIDELPPLQMPSGNFGQNLQSMINVASHSENLESVRTNTNGLNWEDYWNPDKSKENKDHFFVQSSTQSSSLPVVCNNVVPNGSFLKLNPSNLSLSQFGSYGSMAHHQENASDNFNHIAYPLPSHDHNVRYQFDPKQLTFEMLSSSSSSSHQQPLSSSPLYTINQGMVRPLHLSMNPKLFPSEENGHS
uniref:TCP domain-containing protein n=2 Tax=Lactuca sativa TaxID=4236 RepID=A0A9R1VQ12_LACSA|nr:hypothetical protein LSAT_V11C400222930 [Lactuca sativa]